MRVWYTFYNAMLTFACIEFVLHRKLKMKGGGVHKSYSRKIPTFSMVRVKITLLQLNCRLGLEPSLPHDHLSFCIFEFLSP